jgi:hypothetical protein
MGGREQMLGRNTRLVQVLKEGINKNSDLFLD